MTFCAHRTIISILEEVFILKLSMWILADCLSKYIQTNYIKDGSQTLLGVRLFSNDITIEKQYVYLSLAKEFIPSEENKIICVNDNDMILLQTNDMETVLNELFTAFDFYNQWEDKIRSAIYSGCSLQKIVDDSYNIFNDPIVIYDAGNIAVAFSSQYPLGSVDDEWDNIILKRSNSIHKLYKVDEHLHKNKESDTIKYADIPEFGRTCLWRDVYLHGKNMGRVVFLEENTKITQGRMHLCGSFCKLVELWLELNQDDKDMCERTSYFKDLIDGLQVKKKSLLQQLKVLSWNYGDQMVLVKINNSDIKTYNKLSYPLIHLLNRSLKFCYIFEYQSSILVIVNLRLNTIENLTSILTPIIIQGHSFCGISYEFTDIMQLSQQYEQCTLTIENSPKKIGDIYYCKNYALEYIYKILRANVTSNILHPALFILKSNDRDNIGDLYNTLLQYLLNERNLVQTSKYLNIHRNSLLYRVNKIKQLTNIDFNDNKEREFLLLSYRLDCK